MFVRQEKRKNGRVLLRVVENIKINGKVKQKFICGLGSFHEGDAQEISRYTEIGERLIIDIKNEQKPVLPGMENAIHGRNKIQKNNKPTSSYENLQEEARLRVGINDVFAHEFEQMDLFDTIDSGYKREENNKLLKEIVLARIDKPSSKKKSVANIENDRGEKIDLDSVYRMMDKISDREDWVKEKIAKSTLSLFKNEIEVAFFDVTTLYFESFTPDELRSSGYSKDNKVKETQVVLALMTSTDGLPLGYELFPGNTYEGSTLISAVDTLCKKYKVVGASVIADRGMFTAKNLKALEERGVDFIVSAKLRSMKKALKEKMLSDIENALNCDDDIEVWTGEYEYNSRRLVVGYSKKRASKDRRDRERLLERVKKKLKNNKVRVADLVKNTGTKKYLKFEKDNRESATLDEEKIRMDERWDGVYGIISSHDKDQVSGVEIFERYKGLWQVEEAFRVNKHDMKMRPIYHWTTKRIKSHILICYMAYALVSTVRHKLKKKNIRLSIERIKEELGYLQASIVNDRKTGKRFFLPSKITPTQRTIYSALGLKIEEKVRFLN